MFVYVAWFDTASARWSESRARWRRARRYLDNVVPSSWTETAWSGKGWGLLLREAAPGAWRWSFGERANGLAAVSVGFPLGGDPASPATLGARLLAGEDVHKELAAPFALLTVHDDDGRMAVQQDWHGMGQVFRYEGPQATGFSNRPSLLPALFGQPAKPNVSGWSLYLADSAFAGDSSPIQGVRQLKPGARISAVRDRRGQWRLTSERRFGLDDIVAEALSTRPTLDELTSAVVDAVRRVTRSLTHYWSEPLVMGLSGGKDSRLLAASLLDEGLIAGFRTNEEFPQEGKIARTLHQILREERGVDLTHEFYVASPSDSVLADSIAKRAERLQWRHDFMFRSAYLNRPLADPYPDVFPQPGVLGVFGEYVIDEWVPKAWKRDPATASYDGARRALEGKLIRAALPHALRRPTVKRMTGLIDRHVRRAQELGLDPFGALHYGYMLGRIRRTCTSLTNPEQIMPLAVPEMVRAGFQMSPRQRVEWALHRSVIDRAMPGWSTVPVVSTGMPDLDRVRIWHGQGMDELRSLLERDRGPITALLKPRAVRAALDNAEIGKGGNKEDALLRQFAWAAVAEQTLVGGA